MRVLITGSRDWEDEDLIQRTLSLLHQSGETTVPLLPMDAEVRFDGRRDDGTTLSSGRYYLRVEAADTVDSGSVTIMK